MSIKIGNLNVKEIYLGTQKIGSVYSGGQKVFSSSAGLPCTFEIAMGINTDDYVTSLAPYGVSTSFDKDAFQQSGITLSDVTTPSDVVFWASMKIDIDNPDRYPGYENVEDYYGMGVTFDIEQTTLPGIGNVVKITAHIPEITTPDEYTGAMVRYGLS